MPTKQPHPQDDTHKQKHHAARGGVVHRTRPAAASPEAKAAPPQAESPSTPDKSTTPKSPQKPPRVLRLGRISLKLNGKTAAIGGGALAGVLAVVLLITSLVSPGTSASSLPVSLPDSSFITSLGQEEGKTFDDVAQSLATEKFVGTILPETEDAGQSYVSETLFLGDSNTVRMMHYNAVTGVTHQNAIGVVGMGITSFDTLSCVRFDGVSGSFTMPQAVAKLQPRRIVITFGTNNAAGMRVDSFITAYGKALDSLKKAYSYADIIIGSVFPVDQYCENEYISNNHINNFNLALADLAKEKGVKFLNWSEALVNKETGNCTFEYTLIDGIHLTKKGMDAIFTYFRTHSYITQDTRPQVKNVPKIAGSMPAQVLNDPIKPPGPYPKKSSSQSESVPSLVSVLFRAYDETNKATGGGTVSAAGSAGASVIVQAAPGASAGGAVATPAEGYQFVGWSCTAGAIASPGSTTLPDFIVPEGAAPGETITVSAVFRKVQAAPATVTVSFTTDGNGTVDNPGPLTLKPGESVTVNAAPNAGFKFSHWEGAGGGPSLTYTAPADLAGNTSLTIKACFVADAPAQISVPNLVGSSVSAPPAGLAFTVTAEEESDLAPGTILSQNIPEGTLVNPGTAIGVTIAKARTAPEEPPPGEGGENNPEGGDTPPAEG